jgi:MoaA/NifB/PqqE/SkfB family radical SAM enzyme
MDAQSNIFSTGAEKLLSFTSSIDKWRHGDAVPPIALEIHPSEQCNHNCPDCQARFSLPMQTVRDRRRGGALLDMDLLDSIWHSPPAGVIVSGHTGDPLLHPEIVSLLDTLRTRRVPTVLITNLEAMTEGNAKAALLSCRGIRVSLDAWDGNSFRATHGDHACWETVLENLRRLMRVRSELGSKVNCQTGIGFLTDARTVPGMLPATQLARELAVDYIQFRPFHYRASDISTALHEARKFENSTFRVYSSAQKFARVPEQERAYERCHGANFYTVLDARADFYICCHHVGNPDAKLGSLKTQTWEEFVRSIGRRRVLGEFETKQCVPLCRLHNHNETLQQLWGGIPLPAVTLPEEIQRHAPFL